MSDVRGGSQASFVSQSQYSESIVLNPDDAEPDIFKTEDTPLKAPYPTKVRYVIITVNSEIFGRGLLSPIMLKIGSYMSALVLLNLLNELRKRDKMRGFSSILPPFRNKFNKFNNTGA